MIPANLIPANAWDAAARRKVLRTSPCGTYSGPLENGVKFFVLMLEQLGARTEYSCEGHPNNFYVLFAAALPLVRRIHACGYFTVEMENNGRWSLRLSRVTSEKEKIAVLRLAAESWEKHLGCLKRPRAKKAHTRTQQPTVS